jgi:hypothetical protein
MDGNPSRHSVCTELGNLGGAIDKPKLYVAATAEPRSGQARHRLFLGGDKAYATHARGTDRAGHPLQPARHITEPTAFG